MEKYIDPNRIILLFDSYTRESQLLYESVKKLASDCLAIVLEENDFSQDGVWSVYDLMLGKDISGGKSAGKAVYYNEISIPDDWSINAGVKEGYGIISYQHVEKGRIHYTKPKEYFVKEVEWYDRKGVTRFWDHYNLHGDLYARTVCDSAGEKCSKSWFSADGHEMIVENYATGDIILNVEGATKIFHSKIDLFCFAFIRAGLEENRIFYNSLSTPFWISTRMHDFGKIDILFWQEPIRDELPGNMQMILRGEVNRTGKILVQKRDAYSRLQQLGADESMIKPLGFIYSFKKENSCGTDALICTNSDRIEHCEELIRKLPQMHFHIAAVTQMSERLLQLGQYENVSLYQGATEDILEKLFEKCDYYFDVNYMTEIVSAVKRAFEFNHLIFAFEETVHNRDYIADEHIYPKKNFDQMVGEVKRIMADKTLMQQSIEKQHQAAMAESSENYERMMR